MMQESKKQKEYLTISETAKILGVTKETLRNWEKAGKITAPRRGVFSNYRMYKREYVEKILKDIQMID
jgi:DNA (cytosine-5)-methyltransferase 1